MTADTEELLDERERTHGAYAEKAEIIQRIKDVMHSYDGWERLSNVQRESLHMIVHKMGRILSGNPDIIDHWDDIAGYAKLVSRELDREYHE